VRKRTTLPILAGFGVSAPEHAKALISAGADGVVVGSAITEIYSKNLEDPYRKLPEILEFARSMKAACAQAARECKGI
jgi:tryptophan synthase alpha chain